MAMAVPSRINYDAKNADGTPVIKRNTGNMLPPNTRLESRIDSGSNPTRRKGNLPTEVIQCEVDGCKPGVSVVVQLPGVVSASEVEVELAPTSLRVDAPSTGHRELRVDLPQYVEPRDAVAIFSSKAGTLTVTASVVDAPRLAQLAAGEEPEPAKLASPDSPVPEPVVLPSTLPSKQHEPVVEAADAADQADLDAHHAQVPAASIQAVGDETTEVCAATQRVRDGADAVASDEAAVAAAAAKKKDEGSALFRKREYAAAAERYSSAIELTPNDHTLWGNRSLCHIKRNAWVFAARDAAKATELEPNFIKGWARLVRARMELEQDDAAREALRTGLRLDVTNKELSKLAKELKARAAATAASTPGSGLGSSNSGKRERPTSLTQNPEQARIKEDVSAGEYVGTLRWDDSTKFMPLPNIARPLWSLPVDIPSGWEQFMTARLEPNDDGDTVVEPTLLDGLSYPMTLVWVLRKLALRPPNAQHKRTPLTIVAIGAANRSEERLLHQTTYWSEIGTWICASEIRLWLVGPEITKEGAKGSPKSLPVHAKGGTPVVARCFRGTLREFMSAEPSLFTKDCKGSSAPKQAGPSTIIVGFNTGSGSGVAKLMQSWSLDLVAVISSGLPAVFTCANDYSDLAGETVIMNNILGAKFLLNGTPSPFKAVTVLKTDDGSDNSWSCSSCFTYCVQGQRDATSSAPVPALSRMVSAPALGKKIVKMFQKQGLPVLWDQQGSTAPSARR